MTDRSTDRMQLPAVAPIAVGLALFLLGLALRLAHLVTVHDDPVFRHLFIDPERYDAWARRIAGGAWSHEAPFFLDPLYPYFVAAIYAVAGPLPVAVATVQSLLGALVAPVLWIAARRWLERPVPELAGVLAATYAPSIYWSAPLMKPGLAIVIAALSLWCIGEALARGGTRRWVLAGGLFGLTALTRGNLVLLVPLLSIWWCLRASGGAATECATLRSRSIRAAAFTGGALLVLAVPILHNRSVSGEWLPPTTNQGQTFFIGNHGDNPSGRFQQLPFLHPRPEFEQRDFKREAERRAGRPLGHRQVSRFWFAESWRWIRGHPRDWVVLQWTKLRTLWGSYETPASLDYYLYREYAPVLRLPLPGFACLGPLALLGLVLAGARRGWPRLLVLYAIAGTLAIAAFFVLTRFRMVLMPALFVLASLGLVELLLRCREALRGGARAPAGLAALTLAAGVLFVDLPLRSTDDTLAFRVASRIGWPTVRETTAKAHFNLGVTYAARAREGDETDWLRRAEAELRLSLREETDRAALVELGKVLARQERNEEAIDVYLQAAELGPGDYRTHHALGLLHGRRGDRDAAERAFLVALELEPRSLASAIQLGELRLEAGRHEAAAEAFRHALRIDPSSARARRGLIAAGGS